MIRSIAFTVTISLLAAGPAGAAQGPSYGVGRSSLPVPRLSLAVPVLFLAISQDPADSLYRSARTAMNRNEYSRAAELFRAIRTRYPRSGHVADSYYWEAWARYRIGGGPALREAWRLLDEQTRRYPDAATRHTGDEPGSDARVLWMRIGGELARLGDEEAARRLTEEARAAADMPPVPPVAPTPPTPGTPRVPPVPSSRTPRRDTECARDQDDVQTAALNALLQMDSHRAIPVLERVLARRDEGSQCLRRRAVFLVSQHQGPEVDRILLSAARGDPDREVRSQAVFWLSQVSSPRAVVALDSILADARDPEIQDKAVFALSQHDSPEARRALRRYAERSDISSDIRQKAVFWLGQSSDPENITFLQNLYGRVQDPATKERIIFSVAQSDRSSGSWFAAIARNTSESLELRKKALFWMGQRRGTTGAELGSIYDSFTDRAIKEQMIFVLAQRKDRASIDKLIDIARRETDRELQKKAIFWLSQTDDPRVPDVIAEILGRP